MLKYRNTSDGAEYEGDTPLAVVQLMREGAAFTPTRTDRDYMVQVADRARTVHSKIIRSDDPAHFLEDMVSVGLLEEVTP